MWQCKSTRASSGNTRTKWKCRNYPGTFQEYESLPWHGQAAYQSVHTFPTWYWVDEEGVRREGGKWKAVPGVDKGLEYLLVKDAGHMAPGDQRGAVASAVGIWLKNGGRLGDGWMDS